MCSSDFGLGVKIFVVYYKIKLVISIKIQGQSSLVIAGSCRNRPKSSLSRDNQEGRATDLEVRKVTLSLLCPTPNILAS